MKSLKIFSLTLLLITASTGFAMEQKRQLAGLSKKRTFAATLICDRCNPSQTFEDDLELARHLRNVHGARIDVQDMEERQKLSALYCTICEKRDPQWKRQGDLNYHYENEHKACKICFEQFESSSGLFEHKRENHPELFQRIKLED